MRAIGTATLFLAMGLLLLTTATHSQVSDSAYAAALEAVAVDPGILIFPDASVDAKMLQIKPPKNIDPKMIRP